MLHLKLSTAAVMRVGAFKDATDNSTPETAIALASGEAYLFKATGAGVDISALTWAHTFDGMYDLSLTSSETDTLGMLTVNIYDAVAAPVTVRAMVLPALVYDSLYGTDNLQVDVLQINGNLSSGFLTGTTMLKSDVTQIGTNAVAGFLSGTTMFNTDVLAISSSTTAADNLEEGALALVTGATSTGSSTTLVTTGLTEATNDHYNGRTITFTSGALAGQSSTISDYSGSSKSLTVVALTEAPANTDTFIIS